MSITNEAAVERLHWRRGRPKVYDLAVGLSASDRAHGRKRVINGTEPVTESGCWIANVIDRYGYGTSSLHSYWLRIHRLSYASFHGPIPEGMAVCHKCDVRCCANPDHLFIGTREDNMQDYSRKRRLWNRNSTHCKRGHPRETGKHCQECQNITRRELRAKRAAALYANPSEPT